VAGLLPFVETTDGGFRRFRFRFAALPDLRWRVTASPDLVDWSRVLHDTQRDGPPPTAPGWHSAAVVIPATLDPAAASPAPRIFLRLELLPLATP
jgi:hypothetical protein